MRGKGILIRLTEKEKKIAKILREKYAMNISQFFRNKLEELYEELEGKEKK